MVTITFEIDEIEAARLRSTAASRGVQRSEIVRQALRRELARLAVEDPRDAPLEGADRDDPVLAAIATWGPTEDWSDWFGARTR